MNWDEMSGRWSQLKGQAREQWGELTDSDLDRVGGRKDQLVGLLQEKYGYLRGAAERDLDRWVATLTSPAPSEPAAPPTESEARTTAAADRS